MSFKEDVKNIELPKELHERSLKGIKKSVKESKKNNRLNPTIFTIIVTAAMLWFVFSQLNGNPSTNVTTASTKDSGLPPIAISLATIVTVASLIVIVLLWLKKRVSRLLLILSFLAIMSTTWITSLKYTYELVDTEIYPISEEVVSDFMVSISLNYLQPKSKIAPIRALYLNDKNVLTYNYDIQTVFQPFPFRLFNEFTNVYIQIPIEDIPNILNNEPIQARALFEDYTEMDVDIELFTIINKSETTIYYQDPTYEETEQNWIGTTEFHFFKDTYVEEIQFPKRLVGLGSWKLAINNEVIQEGPISAERLDLSRTILKNDAIKLTYEVPKPLNVPLNGWIYFIENNRKIPISRLGQSSTVTEDYLRLIVEKQRGDQREN